MKRLALVAVLVLLLGYLQYRLWFGPGSLEQVWSLRRSIHAQGLENSRLEQRNQGLAAEVRDLKHGLASVEERARMELGMTKQGETFYLVVEQK